MADADSPMNADIRDWGGQYWFQNTRPMYWPMLQSGDFEMMQPLFRMYQGQLPGNAKAVRQYYNHDGAYFAETNPFWGELPNIRPNAGPSWTLHYFTPILELSSMMLDYFAYTGDREFVKQTLLPIADAGLTFFDQHFKRENGKLAARSRQLHRDSTGRPAIPPPTSPGCGGSPRGSWPCRRT